MEDDKRRELSVRDAKVCKDIFYITSHNEPLKKIRIERNRLRNSCIKEATNDNAGKGMEPSKSFIDKCSCYNSEAQLIHTVNKLSVEVTQKDDKETIARYIQNGIFNFGIDLFYGSVEQNIDIVVRLQEVALKASEELGLSIPLSIYLRISPRHQFTGALRNNRETFFLKPNTQVVLTTDRRYASQCCRDVIYVNGKFIFVDVQKCDVIRLGEVIELQAVEIGVAEITCKVIVPGEVSKRMSVHFPPKFEWAHLRISAEELEDITFAMGTEINVLITNSPGFSENCAQIRNAFAEFRFCNYYLFTRLTLENLDNYEYSNIKWMINDFDGFLFDCTKKAANDQILKLSPVVHKFFKKIFSRRKVILLAGSWSLFVHPEDYEIAFHYPDKYVLPCESSFLHLYEAVSHKLASGKCMTTKFYDKSLTGSSTVARSIAAASFEFDADAIIISVVSGQMAEKIAHFRPRTPIIAVTSVPSAINYGSMHYNIWMLLFDVKRVPEISYKKSVHQKLVYGLQYALKKNLINHASKVILVYRKLCRSGFTDKFVIIKFREDYVDIIKNILLAY